MIHTLVIMVTEYTEKYLVPILCKSAVNLSDILERKDMDFFYSEIRLIDALCAKILFEKQSSSIP
jgi:hypothetical protein